ncbi:hypothetical protein GNP80_08935 [Aliivibrio fischeri]|uniref:hypothetical protein n=1 Tax=Aliivibrio fischeri TaxID=668 RepID=UPI0012D924BA|nr:hypothetical protein [Aliivibrio fischeri]MUK92566.1 hypothetical protein [Aliivibrio fischeri]
MKSKLTFMQQYRSYNRSLMRSEVRPTLDPFCIRSYGMDMAQQFENYESVTCRLPSCNIHTRINYRFHAALSPEWQQKQKKLEMMWRSWSN